MDKNRKFQAIIDKAYTCRTIYEQLEQDAGFSGSPRIETASRVGMCPAQADRYRYFAYLVPELQNLVRDKEAGVSSLCIISSHPEAEQREIYSILANALNDDYRLLRTAIKLIVTKYREGLKTWSEIKPFCSEFKAHTPAPKVRPQKTLDTSFFNNINKQKGVDFEYQFADLLRKCGYISVKTTPHSYDKGIDVTAQKNGVRYIFQCKHTKSVGIRALQEIWFAKKDKHHVAVIVTTGRIYGSTRISADERGIKCWTKRDLVRLERESIGAEIS